MSEVNNRRVIKPAQPVAQFKNPTTATEMVTQTGVLSTPTVAAPVNDAEIIPQAQPVFDYASLAKHIPMMGLRPITEVTNWMKMIVYGPYGEGKTHLAGTAALVPEMCDILYLSLEGGEKTLTTIAEMCKKNNIDPNVIMVMPIQTYKQYAQVYETLKRHINARDTDNLPALRSIECQLRGVEMLQKTGWYPKSTEVAGVVAEMSAAILELSKDVKKLEELIPKPKKFRTVITDSLTEAQKYCMYQLLGIDPNTFKLDKEPDSAEWADWGHSREMIQFLVRRLRDLPIHSLFICGQDETEDSKKKKYFVPLLPGKLSKDVQGLVDIVGYIKRIPADNGTISRRLILEGGDYGGINIAAKHRFGTALKGLWVDNPTMKLLYDLNSK